MLFQLIFISTTIQNFRYSTRSITLCVNSLTLIKSTDDKFHPENNEHPFHDLRKDDIIPMDALAASTISFALFSSPTISVNAEILSSVKWDLSSTNFATLAYSYSVDNLDQLRKMSGVSFSTSTCIQYRNQID
ncbi:hypothetical protein FXO38_20245 [Capsicum annuum]|nr:hypothetical protein FXO38_20245 [Capsicum annuum]